MKNSFIFLVTFLLSVFASIAQIKFTVKVPEGTKACFIAGDFNSWKPQPLKRINDSVYSASVPNATTGSQYKYCGGPSFTFVEKAANGAEINNRNFNSKDVVARWAAFWYPQAQPPISMQNKGDVMIQGFNWNCWNTASGWYNTVSSKAAELKSAGINVIWMPPPSDAASNEGYLPRQLYLMNSKYGTQQQLIDCIKTLHNNSIKVLADIVINHRVGTSNWADFTNPTWGGWAITADDEWKNNGGNPCGAYDTGEPFDAGRDLDHTNRTVQRDLIRWLRYLKTNVGFDGWRHDYVKGYAPFYTQKYNDSTSPYISIGEFFDGDREKVRDWLNGTGMRSTAFDFPLKFILATAVSSNYSVLNNAGKSAGLIGIAPANAVTFIDNHDTYRTDGQAFPADKLLEGYAYLLTHPGTPMIFWDHYFEAPENKTAINTLINIRKNNKITNTSTLVIEHATNNEYAAIIDNKVALRLGTGSWTPAGINWKIKATGTNYTVWDKR